MEKRFPLWWLFDRKRREDGCGCMAVLLLALLLGMFL